MATNLRDRGYGSSMDNYNAHKRKVEERKEQEKTTGPVSTLRLPKVNSTASSRAASTSAPIQTQRFYDPNVTRATPGTGGGRGTPHITEQEFNRSTAMTRSYGNYNNYLNGIHVTGSGFADPDILFKNEPNLKNLETVQNQFDQALNVVSGDFEKKASDYERWHRTITNQYQPMSDAQKAQGDQLYADYMKSLDAYQKMSEAHMKASASNAGVYANVSSQRQKWYDSIRDEKDIDIEEKDLMSQLDLLEDQKYKVQSESSYAKTQTLHGITTAQGLETVMNSTDELDRLDRQIDEVKAQLELLDKERAYSRYFKWQELANNNMPVSARRMQGGAPSWLDKIISGTATEEEIMQAINEGNINPSNIAEMLDDEKQTYRAIYQQYGPAKAKEYVDELERYGNIRDSLNTRRRMTDETKLRNWVKKGSPFGRQFAASVLTVLASPTKVLSYVGQGADYLFSGEMTKDADYNVFSYAPNAVTAQIGENITKWGEEHGSKWVQKWGEFGYQTALSIATFLYTTALTGGFGLSQETMFGVELYNQGYRTAEAVSAYKAFKTAEALSLGLMGTEAAADAVMQAKDRGLDDGQAFWMGTAAGAIEILTEKFSVENLLEGVGDRNRLLYFLKSMFTEGSEEVASDFSNMIVDSLVAKDKSEFNQAVKNYMKEYGVSKQEALKAVWTEQLRSVGLSGLGGAISGGFMGGGNIVRSNVSNLFNRSAITSPENVANIIGRAQGLNEWSEGARSASALQRKLDAGEKFTIREVLKARNAIETDRKTDARYVKALIEAAEQFPDAKKQADKLQANLDNGKVKVEDVEKLEEAIDLERLVDPNREDLQTALKYGETADQKSEAYKLTKGVRDKIAAGERLSLEEVSAAESAVNTAKATSAEGLKSTIESGLASDQNSPAYRAAQQLQSKLDSGAEITLAEVSEARRAVRQAEEADFSNTNPEVIGRRLITESGRQALTDAATILKNSTSQSDVQRGNQMLQAIKDGNLDAKTAGEVFLRSQKILENTRNQTARVLQPREVTADMDAYDRSAAKLGVSVEEAAHNKAILQAFGVDGEYKSFENNNLSAYYDRSTGKVYINANAQNPGLALIAHEVTHSFENTAGYKKLADLVFSQSKDLNADLQRITQEYADAGINLDDEGARSELVTEFVEQHMFNDEKFINDVVSTDRSLAQKFLAAIDNLLAKLGNKNAQQRQLLRHARDLWAEALQQRKKSDKAKAKIAEKKAEAKKLTLPTVEAKAAAVKKTEGPNLPKAESRKIQTANAELNQYGVNIDADSGAAVSYSIRTAPTTVDEIKLATDRLVNAGFDRADAESWLKSLTSVSSVIMQNMLELDYEADERYTWLKTNSEYTQGSVDFNNNCPKRAQFTAVFDRLQQMMPDRVFSASDYETIRQILIKHNISVTCGPCFVEDRRQHTGEIAQKFIDQLKSGELKNKFQSKIGNDTYIPTQYDLVTYEGLRGLYDSHRGIHDAFVAFNNARGMQAARLLEGLAEYNNQIKKWNKRTISSKNSKGGLRIFSLSDADPRNMIDMIQIVTDSAEKGLMIQGYTKKPWFARFIKDTGVRILRSHIPAGNGVRNGKLVFDNVEGINTNDADYFDATNERNIGDTVIGINDEMIRIAMAYPSIDQIIPFHTQLAKDIRDQKKIGHWTPYNGLEDRNVSDGKKADKQINIYKDVLQAWEKKGTPITNRQEFVEAFLQVCDERGLIPRFDKFLNTDENGKYVYTPGYEKFLVDYKLFDRTTGEIIPQEAVKPIFDDAYNQSVLENYVKGAKNLPTVSENVFDEIKRHFTDDKLSLPKAESKQYAISKSDTAYLNAVESGDMETAQRMVDKAAKKTGYTIKAYHATVEDFTEFSREEQGKTFDGHLAYGAGFYFAPSEKDAKYWQKTAEEWGAANEKKQTEPKRKKIMSVYLKADSILNATTPVKGGAEYLMSIGVSAKASNLAAKNGWSFIRYLRMEGLTNAEIQGALKSLGYDAVDATSKKLPGDYGQQLIVFDPEQVKSADPVTYDDSGKPIPLSERFNPENKDIRYAVNKDATIRDDQELRDRVREIQDQLDMAEMNGLSDAEIRRLNGQLYKAQAQLDQFTAKQRGLAKKTSINDIIRNIESYDRMDLESLAEQISDNAWDDYEELGDEELREAIVDALNGRMDEMDPGDADKAKYGFYVKPAKPKVLALPTAGKSYAVNKASMLYRTENDFSEPMPIDQFRDAIKKESAAEKYFPKGLSENFIKAISKKSVFNKTKLYRGMDANEMDFLIENKFLKSNGSYNFSNQQGQTLGDEDPGYALSYATWYAPEEIADKHYEGGSPSYLVEFLNSPDLNVNKNSVQESYTYDNIDQKYITRIFEITYDQDADQDVVVDVTDDMRSMLPDLGSALSETAHGQPMFYQDKTTGAILYAVQGNDGWENGRYISQYDADNNFGNPIVFSYDQIKDGSLTRHAMRMFKISGNESDLVPMKIGADGTLEVNDGSNGNVRYAINKNATIRTESELIDSIIDPKETAKAGVQDAVDAYVDSVDMTKEIPGKTAIRTSSKSRGKPSDNGRFLYRKMVDSGEAVSRLGRYANDVYLYPYYNMARASSNAAISMIQNAQTDVMGRRVGDSLNDIFSAIRAKGDEYYSDLQLYLYHLHNIARMSRANPGAVATAQDEYEAWRNENPEFARMTDSDIKKIAYDPTSYYHDQARQGADIIHRLEVAQAIQNKPIFGYEVSAEVSRESAARLREKLEQTEGFEEDVEKIRKYIDNLMQYRIDSGLFTEEQYEKLKKIYPDYVPVFYEYEAETKKGRKEQRTEIGSTVGRAQGVAQETPIMPLHKALAQQTMSAVREGSKNRFGQRLLEKQNLSRNMIKGIDTLLADFNEETFDQPDAKRQNAFVVRQNGKRYEMTLGKDLYEAIDVLSPDPQDTHKLIEIYHKAFDLFKAGVTGYNPVFAVKNPIRDLQDAGLYSKDLSAFVKEYPKTAKEIRKNGKYWQLYQAMGGLYSSVFDYEKGELEEHGWLRRNSLDRMEALNMAIEQAPRLAEFMATIKKAEARGEVTMDDLMEAVHNAADVTVNFGRSGKWGKWLNRNALPFFNPGIQGADKFVRRFTETKGAKDWLRLTGKAALFGILPAILNKLLWGKRKDWDELKQSDRDNYYLFPIPWKEGVWLRLPKGRALALFGMATDRIIQGKDADWASFITTGYSNLGPSNPLKTNFLTPLLEADLFDPDSPGTTWYGGDIESQRLQNLAPGERYDASTDALSKWLGKTFNLSPKKINYILDQYSGVVGDILIPLTSDRAEKDLFSAAFTIDAVTSNRLSEDFYKLNDELTWAKNDPESGPEDSLVSKYWAKQTFAVSDINKAIRAIEEDNTLTDKEKREMIRAQYALRNGIMRNALDTLDDYRKAVEEAYANSTKTDPDDRLDEAYREANRNMFGAEYALQTYNKKVYEAATKLREDNGISYDGFYKFYFARQEVQDQPGTSAECELIMQQDMNDSQKQALYEKYISHKPITLDEGMTMDDFLQAKIDKAAAASEPKISDVMESQAKQNNPNWDSMDSKQQKYATWDEAAKSGNDDALTSSMSESEARKYQTATDHGIDTDVFVSAFKAVDQADLDNDANRSYKQEEVKTALDSMDLTNEQRAVLWQVISSAKSGKNNPYDPDLGQQIYDEMQASKSTSAGSQTKPAPIRPMGLRLPKIG